MGCALSKVDELPAVSLCRHRLVFLHESITQRYALAQAHSAYIDSLRMLGTALEQLTTQDFVNIPPPPDIHLPPEKNVSDNPNLDQQHLDFASSDSDDTCSSCFNHSAHSSPSHAIKDLDYSDFDAAAAAASGHTHMKLNYNKNQIAPSLVCEIPPSSPEIGNVCEGFMEVNHMHNFGNQSAEIGHMGEPLTYNYSVYGNPGSSYYGYCNFNKRVSGSPKGNSTTSYSKSSPRGHAHMKLNYNKSESGPSLVCEIRPSSPEIGNVCEGFVEVNYMQNFGTQAVSYTERPGNSEIGHMGEPQTYNYSGYGNPGSSYYGYSNFNNRGAGNPKGNSTTSYSKSSPRASPPPPPPPQPENSGWDFLNLFDISENANHYRSYVSSRNSKEIREEEGIPDLEDEYHQREEVKEVQGNQKFVAASARGSVDGDGEDGNKIKNSMNASKFQSRSNENVGVDYDVHVVDDQKKTVDHKNKSMKKGNSDFDNGPRTIFEALREIKVQFDNASRSGFELSKILEVGKLQYRKSTTHQVSSKVLHAITPPRCSPCMVAGPNSLSSANGDVGGFEMDDDPQIGPSCLSSSLQKCYLWEKKLLNEVKAEECLRIVHAKKCERLDSLRERGSDQSKIDSTRNIISTLSTKIRFSIQVVDRISFKINSLRDEELWPQTGELIQGMSRMWGSMLECHGRQREVVKKTKGLDAILSQTKPSDPRLEAMLGLERELIGWALRFSSWVSAQKGYVRALNNWLMKCLPNTSPEETEDGIAPFSPGRIGAPPLFVISNQWFLTTSVLSEQEAIHSIRALVGSVLLLWERDVLEMQQRGMANKTLDGKVKKMENEDRRIRREIRTLDRKLARAGMPSSDGAVYRIETASGSLSESLQHVFDTMERTAAGFAEAYGLLLRRVAEDKRGFPESIDHRR